MHSIIAKKLTKQTEDHCGVFLLMTKKTATKRSLKAWLTFLLSMEDQFTMQV